MSNPLVTINLVVLNGEKYIRQCLDGILTQNYPSESIEFNILDNGSTDKTKSIIRDLEFRISNLGFARFNFVESKLNLGMWPGQEELLKISNGKYVLSMAVDVILDKNFIKNSVEVMESDPKIGALQAKIYKYNIKDLESGISRLEAEKTIDTCGFQIFKSRRITNIGHGELDTGQFGEQKEIFGVEGAAPFFRRETIEDVRLGGEFCDHDYFWYADDLDFAWRINLFGWKQVFVPGIIAWHDRQTTKRLRKTLRDFIEIRKSIPIKKRQLEWRNLRFTIIKNDYIINILRDMPYIAKRKVLMFAYLIFFEPKTFLELPNFLRLFPKMLRKRREIMKRSVVSPGHFHKWFN